MPNAPSVQTDQKFLVKGTLYSFLGTALKVIGPVLTIVVARVFGKALFGVYVSTQLLMLTISCIAVLGLDKGLHWYLPQNLVHGRPPYTGIMEAMRKAVAFAGIITVALLVFAVLGCQHFFSGLKTLSSLEITIYSLSLIPRVVLLVWGGASEGNRHPQYKIIINDFAVSALAPVIALGLYYCFGLWNTALPLGLTIANYMGAVAYFKIIRRQFPDMPWIPKARITKELWNYSLPIGFSEVVASFLMRADLWLVLALLGPADAGVYAVMVTISNGLKTIRQSYNPILLPVVAGMSEDRLKTDLKPVYTYCVSMLTLIQLVIGFFIIIFPKETLMIAGKAFVMDPEVLGILLLGNLLNGMFGLSGSVINGLGKSRFMFFMNTVVLIVALASNAVLIPLLGIAGAALSTMLYQVVQSVWMNIYLVRLGLWPYQKQLFVQGLWIFILILMYLFFNLYFYPSIPVKIGIYALALLFLAGTFYFQGLAGSKYSKKSKPAPRRL